MNKITNNIYSIFEEKNRFSTLPNYIKFIKASLIYQNIKIISRLYVDIYILNVLIEILEIKKAALFYSLAPKKTIGNLYGIVKLISENVK